MVYAGDVYRLRRGEALSSLQSKLAEAEKIIAHAMRVRQDIGGIVTRLVALKSKARLLKAKAGSAAKNTGDVDAFERALMTLIRDESSRLFAIIEKDMILLHDLMEFMRIIVDVNHELSSEKLAQSSVKIKIPEISSTKDAEKAKRQIESIKKKIEKVSEEGQTLVEIKRIASKDTEEIQRLAKELKGRLISLRNQFDGMARFEIR